MTEGGADTDYDTDNSHVRGRRAGTDDEGNQNPTQQSSFDPANRTIRFPDEAYAPNETSRSNAGLRGRVVGIAGKGGEGDEN